MRERDDIPEWALEAARARLRRGEEIINAVALKTGTRHVVLLNTSKGAALVVKGMVGAPDSVLLNFPRDLLTYRCTSCAARNVVIDKSPPDDVHCSHCGHPQHLVRVGEVRALGQGDARRDAEAGAAGRTRRAKTAENGSKAAARGRRPKRTAAKNGAKRPAAKDAARKRRPEPKAAPVKAYRPQCLAITPDDAQCRNSARVGSKYCGVHKAYRPPTAKRARAAKDTVPRVKGAKDTVPSARKRARPKQIAGA